MVSLVQKRRLESGLNEFASGRGEGHNIDQIFMSNPDLRPAGNTDSFVISNTSTPHWPTAPFSIGRVDGVVGVSGSLSASIYKNYPVVYLQHSSSDGYEALRINQRGSGEFIYGISKYKS